MSEGNTILHIALRFLPFSVVGVCGAQLIKQVSLMRPTIQMIVFAMAWLVFAVVYSVGRLEPLSTVALGCAGAIGCTGGAMLIARSSVGRSLALLGQASMAIYVLHTLFSAGTRAGFVVFHLDRYELWTLIPEVAAGLLLPVPLWLWSRAHPKGYLFGFGAGPARLRSEGATLCGPGEPLPKPY
jgi:hypothetical protein